MKKWEIVTSTFSTFRAVCYVGEPELGVILEFDAKKNGRRLDPIEKELLQMLGAVNVFGDLDTLCCGEACFVFPDEGGLPIPDPNKPYQVNEMYTLA